MNAMFTAIRQSVPPRQQQVIDRVLSRRQDWAGVAVRDDTNRIDGFAGHYWRVSNSFFNPDTGQWHIDADIYLGHRRPKGEPVYRLTGRTWDMKAIPITVFPTWWAVIVLVATVLLACFFAPSWGADLGHGAWAGWLFALGFATVVVGWTWFYQVEQVRATKVLAIVAIFLAARQATRDVTPFDQPEAPQDWGIWGR